MPRTVKRQKVEVPGGQPYGVAQEQRAAMTDMPLPDNTGVPSPPAGGPGTPPQPPAGGPVPGPGPAAPVPPPVGPPDPMAAFLAEPPPEGGLFNPTGRPDEPVTAGANAGPGPGQEILSFYKQPIAPKRPTPIADTLSMLAGSSPALSALAERARAQGV